MFTRIEGNTAAVFTTLNIAGMINSITKKGGKENQIQLDMGRHSFLGNAEQAKKHFNRWQELAENEDAAAHFFQGQIDNDFYELMFTKVENQQAPNMRRAFTDIKAQPLKSEHDELVKFYQTICKVSFAFINDDGEHCALHYHYLTDDPSCWRMAFVKGTDKTATEQECTILCGGEVGQGIADLDKAGSAIKITKTSTLSEPAITGMRSALVETIIATILTEDGAINPNSDIIEYLLISQGKTPLNQEDLTYFQAHLADLLANPLLPKLKKSKLTLKQIKKLIAEDDHSFFYKVLSASLVVEEDAASILKIMEVIQALDDTDLEENDKLSIYQKLKAQDHLETLSRLFSYEEYQAEIIDLIKDESRWPLLAFFAPIRLFKAYLEFNRNGGEDSLLLKMAQEIAWGDNPKVRSYVFNWVCAYPGLTFDEIAPIVAQLKTIKHKELLDIDNDPMPFLPSHKVPRKVKTQDVTEEQDEKTTEHIATQERMNKVNSLLLLDGLEHNQAILKILANQEQPLTTTQFNQLIQIIATLETQQLIKSGTEHEQSFAILAAMLLSLINKDTQYAVIEAKAKSFLALIDYINHQCADMHRHLPQGAKRNAFIREEKKYKDGLANLISEQLIAEEKPIQEELKAKITTLSQPLMAVADQDRREILRVTMAVITNALSFVAFTIPGLINKLLFKGNYLFFSETKTHGKLAKLNEALQKKMSEESEPPAPK